jgi:hypothetical protein
MGHAQVDKEVPKEVFLSILFPGQAVHFSDPDSLEYFPLGHTSQVDEPLSFWKKPILQFKHREEPVPGA